MVQRITIPKIKFIGKLSNEKKISSFLMVYFNVYFQSTISEGERKTQHGKKQSGPSLPHKICKNTQVQIKKTLFLIQGWVVCTIVIICSGLQGFRINNPIFILVLKNKQFSFQNDFSWEGGCTLPQSQPSMKSFLAKRNHIGSVVNEIVSYTHTHKNPITLI